MALKFKEKVEERYGAFTLRIFSFEDRKPKGMAYNAKNRFESEGGSIDKIREQLKKDIRNLSKPENIAAKYDDVGIDFNVDFTRGILEWGPTGVKFSQEDGMAMVEVADDENEKGFTKLFGRLNKEEQTELYQASFTLGKIGKFCVEPNGRYFLEDETKTPLGRKYTLVFDSVTAGPNDPKRLGKPGLTIACWKKKKL